MKGDAQQQPNQTQQQQQHLPPQQQQHEQNQGGRRLQSLLREVAASDELLKDCIQLREELGATKMKTMRGREKSRQANRARRSQCSLVFDGESWDWSHDFSDVEDGERFGADTATLGEQRAHLDSMAAAGQLVEEFADKMEELAKVVPGLSRSLVELTAVGRFFLHMAVCVLGRFSL